MSHKEDWFEAIRSTDLEQSEKTHLVTLETITSAVPHLLTEGEKHQRSGGFRSLLFFEEFLDLLRGRDSGILHVHQVLRRKGSRRSIQGFVRKRCPNALHRRGIRVHLLE